MYSLSIQYLYSIYTLFVQVLVSVLTKVLFVVLVLVNIWCSVGNLLHTMIYFNSNKPSTKASFGLQIMMNAGTTLDSSSNVCLPEVSWVGDCI